MLAFLFIYCIFFLIKKKKIQSLCFRHGSAVIVLCRCFQTAQLCVANLWFLQKFYTFFQQVLNLLSCVAVLNGLSIEIVIKHIARSGINNRQREFIVGFPYYGHMWVFSPYWQLWACSLLQNPWEDFWLWSLLLEHIKRLS